VADIPFSAVADTLLMPYSRIHRQRETNLRLKSDATASEPQKTDGHGPIRPLAGPKPE
jgi:hypothetical protein